MSLTNFKIPQLDPAALKPIGFKQQHVDFKVIVYRLKIPAAQANITVNGTSVNLNEVLGADFASGAYERLSIALNKQKYGTGVFTDFLSQLYAILISTLTDSTGTPYTPEYLAGLPEPILEEIDISPLVMSTQSTLSVYDAPGCTITTYDPFLTDFSQVELDRFNHQARLPSPTTKGGQFNLNQLRSFEFREFDLVRVYAAATYDRPLSDYRTAIEQALGAPGSLPMLNADKFVLRPRFTGLVVKATRNNNVGAVATMVAQCTGISRMFMQSVTVFSDALANVIIEAGPELKTLEDRFTVFANNLTGKKADVIVRDIFSAYLRPLFMNSETLHETALGVPDMATLLNSLYTKASDGSLTPILLPMLPTIILLHLLKTKFREPIMVFDDRLEMPSDYVAPSATSPQDTIVQLDPDADQGMLEAYMLMARSTFPTFNASYSSASQIFDAVTETTYMEIFEDGTGSFHMRYPRYDQAVILHDLGEADEVSVSTDRDDSAVYTANVTQRVIDFIGATAAIDGRVFLDKISIFRFGFRQPHIIENQNAVSETLATYLSHFIRDYHAGRDSRVAGISIVGRTNIKPGDMVLYRIGRLESESTPQKLSAGIGSGSVGLKAAYVIEVTDSITVGSAFTQNLKLAFVRDASRGVRSSASFPMNMTPWEAVDTLSFQLEPASPTIVSPEFSSGIKVTEANLQKARLTTTAASQFMPIMTVNYPYPTATFRHFLSPRELAAHSNEYDVTNELNNFAGITTRTQATMAIAEADSRINALNAAIYQQKMDLAIYSKAHAIYKDLEAVLSQFYSTVQNLPGTETNRVVPQAYTSQAYTQLRSGLQQSILGVDTKNNSPQQTITFQLGGSPQTETITMTKRAIANAFVSLDRLVDQTDYRTGKNGDSSFIGLRAAWNSVFGTSSNAYTVNPNLPVRLAYAMKQTVYSAVGIYSGFLAGSTTIDEYTAEVKAYQKFKAKAVAIRTTLNAPVPNLFSANYNPSISSNQSA